MTPASTRRLLLAALVLATVPALVMSCASEGWRLTHAPLPPVHVAIDGEALQRICKSMPGARQSFIYFGCAERSYGEGVCRVYTEPNPPAWLLEHERRHCEGESHP